MADLARARQLGALKIPLNRPVVSQEMIEAAIQALQNESPVLGESVFKFEEEFARYIGVKRAISTNSGTDALHISLIALGVGPGDEVVTTPVSFIASANCIIHAGAKPLFADIDMKTYTVDPSCVERAMTGRAKAVLPVHIFGHPADMDTICKLADERGLYVVEDACQAHGAIYKGRRVGSIGHVGCFSFYQSKNMTVLGDGGMVTTDDEDLADKIASLRNCGRKEWYIHDKIGFTARLNTVNAAIGLVQLRHLDEWNEARRRVARLYYKLLSDIEELILPPRPSGGVVPVYHQFVVRARRRDELRERLAERGVQTAIHYPLPIHLQPIYMELYGYKGGEYPAAEEFCRTCLSLPMYPELELDDVRYVCETVREFFGR